MNYADASKQIGVTSVTVKQWVSIMVSSWLIYLLQPFSSSLSKRLIKTPKVYFMDTGLCCYLNKISSGEVLLASTLSGAMFETYVVSEIIKSHYNNAKDINLYYYRDKDQKEIDLVYQDGNDIYPIEIKKGYYPQNPDKNFSVLSKYGYNVMTGIVICMNKELMPINRETWLCPISIL